MSLIALYLDLYWKPGRFEAMVAGTKYQFEAKNRHQAMIVAESYQVRRGEQIKYVKRLEVK